MNVQDTLWMVAAIGVGAASVPDLRWHRIPNWLVACMFAAVAVCQRWQDGVGLLVWGVMGVGVVAPVFGGLWMRNSIGSGDVKLGLAVVFAIGPLAGLFAVFGAIATGAFTVLLRSVGREPVTTVVPSGVQGKNRTLSRVTGAPCLAVGLLLARVVMGAT